MSVSWHYLAKQNRSWSTLTKMMVCRLLALSRYLNQYWHTISVIPGIHLRAKITWILKSPCCVLKFTHLKSSHLADTELNLYDTMRDTVFHLRIRMITERILEIGNSEIIFSQHHVYHTILFIVLLHILIRTSSTSMRRIGPIDIFHDFIWSINSCLVIILISVYRLNFLNMKSNVTVHCGYS